MKHDKTHFDDYTAQTRTKHAILTRYLPAYLTALKHQVDYYHYIDGFAGRGEYANSFPGSPRLVLDRIAEAGVAARTTLSLVESDPEFCTELEQHLCEHPTTLWLARPSLVRSGKFSDHLPEILARPIYDRRNKTATFAFVDPCGVDGVTMENLAELLDLRFGEVLLFFNYDAVNRLIGAYLGERHEPRALTSLFGSREAVEELVAVLAERPNDKEAVIRERFFAALQRHTRAGYFVPFRFQAKDARRTSHYLIHCSSHWLPFRLMKSVMWEAGREGSSDPYGRLEFLTDAERNGQFALFRPDIDEMKSSILTRLRENACPAGIFLDDWVNRPEDPYSEEVYRQAILDLETAGAVVVYDKANAKPRPQDKRLRSGRVTLGKTVTLRVGVPQLALPFGS